MDFIIDRIYKMHGPCYTETLFSPISNMKNVILIILINNQFRLVRIAFF